MTSKEQKRITLSILKHATKPLSMATLADKVGGIPPRTLRRWLAHWVESGLVEKLGQGRATCYQYIKTDAQPHNYLAFLDDLDGDLKAALLCQLRDLWTHNSTAIEGNTLTLGDTHFVLEEGLTISGKPLKDHQEVIGHAKAIELVYKS